MNKEINTKWLLERLETMLNTAKKIKAEQIEKSKINPDISSERYAAGMVDGLEIALKTVKEMI